MKRLLMMIGAAAIAGVAMFPIAAQATTAAYSAGDASLADGKITVEYDANNKVTRLSMNPAAGETLTLTGDALSFADGAAIIPGADGESVVSNAVSFAGAVKMGITNISWYSAATLPKDSYETVFANVALDDISPVSTDFSKCPSACGLKTGTGYPFWVKRTGSGANAVMTVEFQYGDGGNGNGGGTNPISVKVELRQNGSDVEAKIVNAAQLDRVRLLGQEFFTGAPKIGGRSLTSKIYASDSATSGSYGIAQMTFGPRRDTCDSSATVTSSGVLVASGVDIADYEVANGLGLVSSAPYYFGVYNTVFDEAEDTLTVQLIDNLNYRYCVKVQLYMSGSDIYARQIYVKDAGADKQQTIYDFDDFGTVSSAASINMLALRRKAVNRKLTFIASGETTLNAVSGGNVDVTFKTLAADAPVPTTIENIYPYLGTAKTLVENANLATMTVTGATFGGPKWNGSDWVVVDFANNGSTASFQIQCHRENLLQCMDVELSQNGDDIEITTTAAFYANWADYADEYYNKKTFPVASATGSWAANRLATSDTGNDRFNLDDLTYTLTPKAYVYATGANTLADSSLSFYGAENNSLNLHVTDASAFNAACPLDCYAGTTMYIDDAATYRTGVVTGMTQTMHTGSVLVTPQKFAFHRQNGKLVLDGATLLNIADEAYFNYIAFSNAAVVASASGDLRAGGVASPVWNVGGTGMSSLEGDVKLVAIANAPSLTSLTIDVAEVAEGTDFLVTGDIVDLQASNIGYLVKTGAGTMQLDGAVKSTGGALSVAEGTLLLGVSSDAHTDFSLDGGTLAAAAGTTHTAGTLAVTAASSLEIASGATLTFADLEVSSGATLNATVPGKTNLKVSAALSAEVLSRIRINGERARQDADGYLRRNCGLVISFH